MYQSDNSDVNEILKRLDSFNTYQRIRNILDWDMETIMPEMGNEMRGIETAEISGVLHQKFLSLNKDLLLDKLFENIETLNTKDKTIIADLKREYDIESKIPEKLVRDLSLAKTEGTTTWQKARNQNDVSLFLPKLEKIIEIKKEIIKHKNSKAQPYDELLDEHEPGLTTEIIKPVLEEVKRFTLDMLNALRAAGIIHQANLSHEDVYIPLQKDFNDYISSMIGFDFSKGATGISTHPFTTETSPRDVRFTSRYKKNDFLYAITSTMHETGHALYEQNLPYEYYGTPLAKYISLGIHESQSRFYENQIGRSRPFSNFLTKQANERLNISVNDEEVFQYLNAVNPSLIRVEADELTYNLHIIIRFEIEEAIFNDNLPVSEIETMWNEKYQEYLGITPSNSSEGMLQDVHWSQGLFGYFPTYTLGNIYSAQIAEAMKKDIDLEKVINKSQYSQILDWLTNNIYKHGRSYTALELIENISGSALDTKPLENRLQEKIDMLLQ